MQREEVDRGLNTLRAVCHVGSCAEGFTALIRSNSVGFFFPRTDRLPMLLFPLRVVFVHPALTTCCTFALFCCCVCVCGVTHQCQVTDNISWTWESSLPFWGTFILIKGAVTSVFLWKLTQPLRVRFTSRHSGIIIHTVRLSENTLSTIVACFLLS